MSGFSCCKPCFKVNSEFLETIHALILQANVVLGNLQIITLEFTYTVGMI
jgi:hypothetical protein